MIGAAVPALLSRGHEIDFIAVGPAETVWRAAGHRVGAAATASDFERTLETRPDAMVAGTGFGEFERGCWQWARGHRLPAMAAIDSWTNILRRFETQAGADFPDLVAVIDAAVADEFRAVAGPGAADTALAVVGQPHLETQTARLRRVRGDRRAGRGGLDLVFFSEPIIEDFGPDARGYDQFGVVETLAEALGEALAVAPPAAELAIRVKPHPREATARWQELLVRLRKQTGLEITLTDASAESLLGEIDGALGMTSMVLVEAHLAGIPVLSLQPSRRGVANPVVEDLGVIVADANHAADRIGAFIERLDRPTAVHPRFQSILTGAAERFASAAETLLEC